MARTIADRLQSLYNNLVIAINFINEGINLKADKVSSATSGNLAGLDNTGNLTDSGKKASDFAAASHTHTHIIESESDGSSAKVTAMLDNIEHAGYVEIELKNDQRLSEAETKTATINFDNFANLNRALLSPAAPVSGGNVLITNGQVYTALGAKADKESVVEVTDGGSASSQALSPNTLYVFTTRTSNLTLTLTAGETGKVSEYHLFLVTGSTAPTITWDITGLSWNGGSAPTIAASKTYEVSILNNVAAFFEI